MVRRSLVLGLLVVACRAAPPEDTTCTCTPANVSLVKHHADDKPMDGEALLGQLRRHKRDVEQGKNKRDIKVFDDELRFAVSNFCQPCGMWVSDTVRIEAMFPLDRLDDATRAVCLGLVLRDGTTVYGDAHPRACR